MHRLVIGLASVNLLLSGAVVYHVVSYKTEMSKPLANPYASIEQPPLPFDNTNEPNEDVLKNNENDASKKEKVLKILTTDELHSIPSGRNPFGTAPIVDLSFEEKETSYQRKVEDIQHKYEQLIRDREQAAQQEGNNSSTVTDNNTEDTTETNDTEKKTDTVKINRLDKIEAISLAKGKAKKYQIPAEWIISIIEETSEYQTELIETKDNVTRTGIMQIRDDKAKFVMESLGRYYQPSLTLNSTMNIEMGAWYLSYLSQVNSDTHYVFTSYYHGENFAKTLHSSQANYQTMFSEDILRKSKTLKLN